MLDIIGSFIAEVLCFRLGQWIIKTVSFGRYPGRSSYWYGLCSAAGGLAIIAIVALSIYIISI
ncbi:hypothetical protein D3879_09545 [Pseudomonas cavernicola]|uniref:Uncharacterized protein n=1 Tax=Pseudomonas cavernicola TaxID=2320866 RepID=A0A418XLW6_9PSED|nr:hypothetical protein D3879_09545 [Pseudomonas cavernicola]